MTVVLLVLGALLTGAGVYVLQRPRIDRSFAWSILIVGVLLLVGTLARLGVDLAA